MKTVTFAVSPAATVPNRSSKSIAGLMAVVLSVMLSAHPVWGAALELYETGAPDLGTASAGTRGDGRRCLRLQPPILPG